MLVIALGNIFGKYLIIDSLNNVYFYSILNEKWLFSSKNNDIGSTHARGHAPQQENLEKMCNLVRLSLYFDQILH